MNLNHSDSDNHIRQCPHGIGRHSPLTQMNCESLNANMPAFPAPFQTDNTSKQTMHILADWTFVS